MFKFGLFHGDGSPFNPDRFERELKEGVMTQATNGLQDVLRDIVCPDHHQRATLERKGDGWELRACCQKLKDAATKRLPLKQT